MHNHVALHCNTEVYNAQDCNFFDNNDDDYNNNDNNTPLCLFF